MEPKNSKIFRKDIIQAVSAYCESEKIEDIDHFMFLCFKQGFDIKRYGLLGETLNESEKDLIKEVIVEKIVEVPVEVIKEVEKIVTVTDNEELEEKIIQLNNNLDSERKIFSIKMEEMENNFQNEMSKKDKELDELRLSLDILKKDDKTKLLQETLQSLRKEIQQKNEKIKELETINRDFLGGNQNQAYLLRGSNLKDRI